MARGVRWLVLPAVVFACTAATAFSGGSTADREHKTGHAGAASPGRDRDRDGLSDDAERRNGTNPRKRDTDGDRLNDGAERRHHTNPRARDTDGDRLGDGAEVNNYHTNPRKRDTDGDGLQDGDEISKHKTNPRKRDTDADGFGDNVELRGGTNPRHARSHLGFPDASNTGVPRGTTLTPRSGSFTVSTNNTVIDAITTTGCITVTGYGVTIKNSKVGCIVTEGSARDSANPPLTVQDTEIVCPIPDWYTGLQDANLIAERLNIHGCANGVDINNHVTIRDSYIHDLFAEGEAHTDGIQAAHGSDSLIEHNTIYALDTSAIIITNYDGHPSVDNTTIRHNLLSAQDARSVSHLIYCTSVPSSNFHLIDNHFSIKFDPKGGVAGFTTECSRGGEIQSGNVIHETGAPLTLE